MESFLCTEGSTLVDAIAEAAAIANCAPDEIAYRVVATGSTSIRILAACLDIGGDRPKVGRVGRLRTYWRSSLARDTYEFAARSRDRREPPADICELLDLPPSRALPLEPLRTVDGDISSSDCTISHFGDLNVRGNVSAHARVSARGRVMIFGNVELDARIIATNQIVVLGGTMGALASRCGDIQCGFARNCRLYGNAITIRGDAEQCDLIAGKSIDVAGAIIGGRVHAEREVSAMTIGDSKATIMTTVRVGGSRRLYQLIDATSRRFSRAGCEWIRNFYAENLARLFELHRDFRPFGRITTHREFRPPTLLGLGAEKRSIEESAGAGTFWIDDDTGKVMAKFDE
jgi:hypothetical protein